MVLGAGGEEALDVELGAASAEVLRTFQLAGSEQRKVLVDYYSFGRDEVGERVVQPWRLFSSGGHWYLLAWCEKVADKRLFRVDRVRSATLLDEQFDPPARPGAGRCLRGQAGRPAGRPGPGPGSSLDRSSATPTRGPWTWGTAMSGSVCGPVPGRGWKGSCFGPGRMPPSCRAPRGYYRRRRDAYLPSTDM